MFRKILALTATALLTQTASANVLYTWQQVTHSSSMPEGLHLELLFTDTAVAKGSLDMSVINACAYGDCRQQQDSLLALRYWYAGADGSKEWNMIDYRLGDETQSGFQRLSMSLQFIPGGKLSGMISANDGFSDFTMQGNGAVFTMLSAHSDEPYGCGFANPSCQGDRGHLVANTMVARRDSQPLPEPDGLAMLGIGAVAALAARRRRTRAS